MPANCQQILAELPPNEPGRMTDFIDIQRATYADLGDKYAVLGELYEKKYVHAQT